ncbi:diguanylate cyclase [Uliginosibacterium sp. 31-16]|uniref:sensor domain-containing diguanylate cyclase n=1 Tax=Uliginosibacterium sp. 31-16 TaxID=3068315 RepID=UPI00273D53ED|nr:sensor domain-containing diguanylate cyclase [Uliginosibacterium sp. 31-16]MDP5238855.1 diguanylate cyclase [Uliginosibacterium sp. 31-16]
MFSLTQLTAIFAALPDPVFVLTRGGRYVAVLGGADTRYYHDGSFLVGQTISEVLMPEKAGWFLDQIAQALQSGKLHVIEYGLASDDVKGLTSEGPQQTIWFEGRVQALPFAIEGEEAVVWVASNITARHELELQLRRQSETDALTGLCNRRHFEQVAATECERAQRYGHPISLLIFDVDHFKSINDGCGHEIGDRVLQQVALAVKGCTRDSDLLTRWGGDEFTVLMPHADIEHATEAAEKIRSAIARELFVDGLQISVSIGAAQWQVSRESVELALAKADEALYRAKALGRNRAEIHYPEVRDVDGNAELRVVRLLWRRHFESGHGLIDAQHRQLFESVDQLQSLLADPAAVSLEQLRFAVDRLMADVTSHFTSEEQVLGALAWPGLAAHQADHQRLLGEVAARRAALEQTPEAGHALRLARFVVVEVVANHMLQADRQFYPWLRQGEA